MVDKRVWAASEVEPPLQLTLSVLRGVWPPFYRVLLLVVDLVLALLDVRDALGSVGRGHQAVDKTLKDAHCLYFDDHEWLKIAKDEIIF